MNKNLSCLMLALSLVLQVYAQVGSPHTTSSLPDPLITLGGRKITDSGQWESLRREEILDLFRDHVYGRVPGFEPEVSFDGVFTDRRALDGKAVMKEVEIRVSNGKDTLKMNMLLFLPADAGGAVPVFLGLNFYGNQTVHPDTQISITPAWTDNEEAFGIRENRAPEASRGVRVSRWPVELILERGYGLATICYGEIDPDYHDGFRNGI
ncbi:MAG: acetylxylan esterase, partial [Bacteroidetes bacterium]